MDRRSSVSLVDDPYSALGKDHTVSGLVCPKGTHRGSSSLTLVIQ